MKSVVVPETDETSNEAVARSAPTQLKILAALLFAFGLFALAGSLFLWGQGFILQAPAGVDLALPLADILINAPASLLAAVGLWRLRRYGYVAGYFVAGLYLYASTFIIADALLTRPADFWAILVPQILAVAVALALLWLLPRWRPLFR